MTRSRDVADTQDNLGGAVAPFVAGKNKIINGDFGIWQRGTSFTGAGSIYCADRFRVYLQSTVTASRQTFAPGTAPVAGYEGTYFLRIARTATSATDYLTQKIEDVRAFAGQRVTLSFWAKADTATTISLLYAEQNFGTGGSLGTATNFTAPSITTSWARYSTTITIPSVAGATIGTNSFLDIVWGFETAMGNRTIDIWGVQLEAGSVATPFQIASGSIGGELALCQRYYYRLNWDALSSYQIFGQGGANSTTQARTIVPFGTQLRVKPTAIDYPTVATYFTVIDYADAGQAATAVSIDTNQSSSTAGFLLWTVTSGLTANRPYIVRGSNSTGAYLGWSAEL